MSAVFAGIGEVWRVYRERVKAVKDTAERADIAAAFNDRYTYREEYVKDMERLVGTSVGTVTPRGGYAWMCPDCNKIHHPTHCSVFSGLQYPRCCTTPEGNRLNSGIRYERY